jgi:Ca2+/H+ antiporter
VEGEAASDSDECKLAFWVSIVWLTILTIFISILSEYLIDAIEVCGQTDRMEHSRYIRLALCGGFIVLLHVGVQKNRFFNICSIIG